MPTLGYNHRFFELFIKKLNFQFYFSFCRGSDESRCQVKISGDMMLSFPAGIAGLLANNPNPSKLGFRIKNVQNLDNFIPNSKLVQV